MKKVILLIMAVCVIQNTYSIEGDFPISVNTGLSVFNSSSFGVNIDYPLSQHIGGSLGFGSYGGYSVGLRFYENIQRESRYVGIGYGVVELQEDLVESQWVESLGYGGFIVVGRRFILEGGDFLNVGAGLFYRPEEKDKYSAVSTNGGYASYTFDLTYGFKI